MNDACLKRALTFSIFEFSPFGVKLIKHVSILDGIKQFLIDTHGQKKGTEGYEGFRFKKSKSFMWIFKKGLDAFEENVNIKIRLNDNADIIVKVTEVVSK